jgi:hypothetical protein
MMSAQSSPHERAKLRASQERKLQHATSVISELIRLHMPGDIGEREQAELHMMSQRLFILIKHQHVKDREYATEKMDKIWLEEGSY